MKDLLFEIGTEEIPAGFMPGALRQLEENAAAMLQEERLDFEEVLALGTPRRLVLQVSGLAEEQKAEEIEVRGPSVKAAYDAEGNFTKAALGFCRGQGVDPESLTVKDNYVYAYKKAEQKDVSLILSEQLPVLVQKFNFPKPMRWGSGEMRFARPIRWLTALLGSEIIPMEIAGVQSGNVSRGHRFLGQENITVASAEAYLDTMRENFVIVDQEEREVMILQGINDLVKEKNAMVPSDDDLLEEVVYLVEYPTVLMGSFAERYLEMPQEAVITPMKEHQRYFPVLDKDGKLMPNFITVRNGTAEYIETVREGNEKVLEARLSDARFFFDEDRKIKLEEYIPKLKNVVFQEQLGTIYEKVERIIANTEGVAVMLEMQDDEKERALRAAYLAKADLETSMVYEFPELQGIMGEKYALASGEEGVVAKAVYEHYLPRFAGDDLPETAEGTAVSMAEKMDNIAGCFAVGVEPTGSQDPYGLRRQALGLCRIILASGKNISLSDLIYLALEPLRAKADFDADALADKIHVFFEQRVKNILEEEGCRYDVIDAVLTAGYDRLVETVARARALEEVKGTETFSKLIAGFTRANNLLKKAEDTFFSEEYLKEAEEKDLFDAWKKANETVLPALDKMDYVGALEAIAGLEEPINSFFDHVMVMDKDENIRKSRLGLLELVTGLAEPVADLTKIVQA